MGIETSGKVHGYRYFKKEKEGQKIMVFEEFEQFTETPPMPEKESNPGFKEKLEDFKGFFTDVLGGALTDIPEPRLEDVSIRDDIPGLEGQSVAVCGEPLDAVKTLDYIQGDSGLPAVSDCGVVSSMNVLTMCGIEGLDEGKMIRYAAENNRCRFGFGVPEEENGGTTVLDQRAIIESHGVDVKIFVPVGENPVEELAMRFEGGCAGIINLNAGYLWDDPASVQDGRCNHAVTMTGTVRDCESGELLGITVCDSGIGSPCTFVSTEKLEKCFVNAPGAAVFTTDPVRK